MLFCQLLHGDYLDPDLKVDTDNGQTEYEFPLLTTDKQKKSDRVTCFFTYPRIVQFISLKIKSLGLLLH